MSSTSNDPYGTDDDRDRSSGSTPPPPPGGDTPAYGSIPGGSSAGGPPAYGSTPPAYGSSSYGGSSYGSTPPAYGGGDTGQSGYGYGYPKNNLGVWSFVLGLIGIVLSCGLFTGIPAIIVGHKSRRAIAEGQANNSGMATAGIIMGWIATILSILGILALIFLIATGAFAEYAMMTQTPTGTDF